MQKKIQKIFFNFYINAFEFVAINSLFYWEKILLISCQYVNKQSQNSRYNYERLFGAQCLSKSSKNMKKLLTSWFKQCFGPINMFTVRKCSHTGLFRHLSNPLFGVHNSRKISPMRLLFSSKYSKSYENFGNGEKNSENIFQFGDNSISIGCFKHSLLLRQNICHTELFRHLSKTAFCSL